MKKLLLIISILLNMVASVYGQVISVKADVSPIFPHVYEEETKVLKYGGPYSILYFDSLDSTYMCEIRDYNYYNMLYSVLSKWGIPFNSKISDMYTSKNNYVWYCGKEYFWNHGMYGWMNPPNSFYPTTCIVKVCSLDDMDELKRMVIVKNGSNIPDFRMFAIGSTIRGHNTHVVDLNDPELFTTSYNYATVDTSEYLDDLELVEDYVVFATRKVNSNNILVNLRVMDIWDGLASQSIDARWNLLLPSNELVYENVYVEYLGDRFFEVCYIKYSYNDGYVLCLHRINMDDMLAGVNSSTISQEIAINKGEFIQDLVYDRVEGVLVIMLDKEDNHSVFLHTVPEMTMSYPVIRLESDEGDRYFSIDTMASYSNNPGRMYQAWGGTKCFVQGFSTDGVVSDSCIPFDEIKAICVSPVIIEGINDPLIRNIGTRSFFWENENTEINYIHSNCFIEESKTSNE